VRNRECDTAKFCSECGAPLTVARPAARREERKVVSVVSTDLVGSTARAEESDPEDVRASQPPAGSARQRRNWSSRAFYRKVGAAAFLAEADAIVAAAS
jgi:hypothetical protein